MKFVLALLKLIATIAIYTAGCLFIRQYNVSSSDAYFIGIFIAIINIIVINLTEDKS